MHARVLDMMQLREAHKTGRVTCRQCGRPLAQPYRMGGPYRADAAGSFSVGELVTTLMAGPEDAMRAERAYLILLRQARAYKRVGGTLTLYDQGGNESLIFEASTP